MVKILVLLREPEQGLMGFDRLAQAHHVSVVQAASLGEARAHLADAEVLITLPPHIDGDMDELFGAMPCLRWVQLISTGTDAIADHLDAGRTALTSARGLHGRQMSEAAIGAMLALARGLPLAVRNQRDRAWSRQPATLIAGKTVGILGLGAIADALAPRCQALGMKVVGITGAPRPLPGFDDVRSRRDLAAALADLDHLVLLAPYSAATHRLIDATAFAAMKRGAFLINLARGGIVDEAALIDALNSEQLAGAALDVFETEPLPEDSPLWAHPNILVTPHVGGLHDAYAQDVHALVADNLGRYLDGGADALINLVPIPEAVRDAAE